MLKVVFGKTSPVFDKKDKPLLERPFETKTELRRNACFEFFFEETGKEDKTEK